MATYDLSIPEVDTIRLALRPDVDIRRYVPEVMSICRKLGLPDPPWFEDAEVRERVAFNREATNQIPRQG